jgi:hypothetical protein
MDTGSDPGTGTASDPGTGTGTASDPGGSTTSDSGSGTDPGAPVPGVEVVLKSGEKVTGQLIAEYDHSGWWVNPSNEVTLGIFDGSKFGEYPNDKSMRFLSSYDVVSVTDVTLPAGTIVYRDMLRDKGMTISTMPVSGGPLYIAGGNGGYHADENGNGNFAWDIVRANAGGQSFTGSGQKNQDYLIWDAPVVLPVGGTVMLVIRDEPDNVPGQFNASSQQNMIGLHVGGQYYLFFLHMRQGSIPDSVQEGVSLPAGTVIGNVGNSGASVEPHLHMTLLWYEEAKQKSWSVPSEWAGMWTSSSPSGPSTKHDYLIPEAGTWISSSMF